MFEILTYSRVNRVTLIVFGLLVLMASEAVMARDCPCNPNYAVYGLIGDRWRDLGGSDGPLGCPTGAERDHPNGRGRYQEFEHGSIAYTADADNRAPAVLSAYLEGTHIRVRWSLLTGRFGYDMFIVRWEKDGRYAGQQDVFTGSTSAQYTINVTEAGQYKIYFKGCIHRTIGPDTCHQDWSLPVYVTDAPRAPIPPPPPISQRRPTPPSRWSTRGPWGEPCTTLYPGVPAPFGLVRQQWMRLGGPNGPMGCPTTGVISRGGRGESVRFENGEISWSPQQQGILGTYQEGGDIVVDWTVVSNFRYEYDYLLMHYTSDNYDKFQVHWTGPETGQDELWDTIEVYRATAGFPLGWTQDTHLRTKGTHRFSPHREGVYDISVQGCNMGMPHTRLSSSHCDQHWMQSVRVDYRSNNPRAFVGFLAPIDWSSTPPASSVEDAKRTLEDRTAAVLLHSACLRLAHNAYRNEQDYGTIALAKLAYADYFDSDRCPGRDVDNRVEAAQSLLRQHVESRVGTTSEGHSLRDEIGLRTGEYDVLLTSLIPIIYRYHQALPWRVSDHIVNELLSVRGPFNPDDLRPFAPLSIPESENHLLNIETSRYLTNQLVFARRGDAQYDNSRNGMDTWMLNHLQQYLRTDFIEYNARPYQSYSAIALQNLYSYAYNPQVKTAAQMVLDYISAKVVASSNDARRSVPFRRRVSHNDPAFIDGVNVDPQTPRMMMLAGITDILREASPSNQAPWNFFGDAQRVALSEYRLPDMLLDLLINRSHRVFYQGFHHYADELYAGSPSYLISAGGHHAPFAYEFHILGRTFHDDDDLGLALPTTLMPTGRFISRDNLIRFEGDADDTKRWNMCVAPDFACGLRPMIPSQAYDGNCGVDNTTPPWTFIDQSGRCAQPPRPFGYYVAVYQRDGFGFFEAFDTTLHPSLSFQNFVRGVRQRNGATSYNPGASNTYVTTAGARIQFTVTPDSKILSIDNVPQPPAPQPRLAFGSLLNSDGQSGWIKIRNPFTNQELILDDRDPLNPVRTLSGEPSHGTIYVDLSYNGQERGTPLQPFKTITAGYNAAQDGDWIIIQPGYYSERPTLSKRVTLTANGGAVIIGRCPP